MYNAINNVSSKAFISFQVLYWFFTFVFEIEFNIFSEPINNLKYILDFYLNSMSSQIKPDYCTKVKSLLKKKKIKKNESLTDSNPQATVGSLVSLKDMIY